jgi:hypothetical protein
MQNTKERHEQVNPYTFFSRQVNFVRTEFSALALKH